ncbi:MAG: carbohydrate ABC transporter permease [Aestuariivirga sp.]|uniref:carbohydrate ABC transporter permease n=1 Tax=Aestuariivirga sp. TaxID=2650926 RepID=UPI003015F171
MAASQSILGRAGIVLALVVFVFAATGPIVWLLLSSVLQQQALTSIPPDLSPSSFTLANYLEVFSSAAQLGRAIINSLIVATFTTALAIILGAPAAYALARLEIKHAGTILLMVLAAQMFPAIVIAIPLFITASKLGLIDTKLLLILVYLSFNLPIVIWVLRGFFMGLPLGLERAARVDGASPLQTFLRIVLPISLPSLFAAAIFAFIEAWNEFFFALIMTRQTAQTVPLAISAFAGQYQTMFGQMMAAAAISVAPIILLTILLRNTILRGFADGMLKG